MKKFKSYFLREKLYLPILLGGTVSILGNIYFLPVQSTALGLCLSIGLILYNFKEKGKKSKDSIDADKETYIIDLLLLSTFVIKSDGVVDPFELSYVRKFLIEQFNFNRAEAYFIQFERILSENLVLERTILRIDRKYSYVLKTQLLYWLYGIAAADYSIDTEELVILEEIGRGLSIKSEHSLAIEAMYIDTADADFKILGVQPRMNPDFIERAYKERMEVFILSDLTAVAPGLVKSMKEKADRIKQAKIKVLSLRQT
jgi:DnaJ like chaperone protein